MKQKKTSDSRNDRSFFVGNNFFSSDPFFKNVIQVRVVAAIRHPTKYTRSSSSLAAIHAERDFRSHKTGKFLLITKSKTGSFPSLSSNTQKSVQNHFKNRFVFEALQTYNQMTFMRQRSHHDTSTCIARTASVRASTQARRRHRSDIYNVRA